jgi:hypothetical protein
LREGTSVGAALWRVLHFVPALRVTAIVRRGILATVNFGDETGLSWPVSSPKFSVAKKPSPRGGVKPRLAIAQRLKNTLGACCGEATAKRLGLDAEHGDGMQDKAGFVTLSLRGA